MIPLSNRKTINYLVLFKCVNKAEINSIWEEMTFLNKEDFYDLIKFVFQKPFDYLVLDRDANKYFKKIDELIIKSENENASETDENEKQESK